MDRHRCHERQSKTAMKADVMLKKKIISERGKLEESQSGKVEQAHTRMRLDGRHEGQRGGSGSETWLQAPHFSFVIRH